MAYGMVRRCVLQSPRPSYVQGIGDGGEAVLNVRAAVLALFLFLQHYSTSISTAAATIACTRE